MPTEVFTYGMSGLLEYNGFYHLVGKCAANALQWLSVAERFEVGFTQNIDMQPDEIPPERTLQMEISFQLPWLLDEPYSE